MCAYVMCLCMDEMQISEYDFVWERKVIHDCFSSSFGGQRMCALRLKSQCFFVMFLIRWSFIYVIERTKNDHIHEFNSTDNQCMCDWPFTPHNNKIQ